jgi:diguanylate cyclase (GGDEF)-like protein
MSHPTGRSIFRFLIAVAAGVICTAALTIALTIWWLRSEAIAGAFRDSSNLAEVLASQTASSIQSIDLILAEIKAEEEFRSGQMPDFDRVIGGEGTHEFLLERLSHLPQAEFIALVDKNGKLANTTLQWPTPGLDLSDRAYFQHFRNNDGKGVYISDALINRNAGTRFVSFTSRISGVNNTFLGVVVVGVRLTYFQQIYKSIASLPDQSFVLSHRDGTIIVRYPDFKDRVYKSISAKSPWHRLVSQGGGTYRLPDDIDAEGRLVAVRPLREYPLVVNVGVSEAAALATWRIQAIAIGAGTLLFVCCSLFLLRALSRQFHSLERSKIALVKKTGESQRAKATVDAALNNLVQAVIMFDSNLRLTVCNQRYLDMYGLSRDVVRPGSSLQKIVEHRAAIGSFSTDDVGQYVADILAAIAKGTVFSRTQNLRDGRIIHIVSQPIEGDGWVTTHEDVTEAKRAEERISHLAHHDALTGLPNRKLFYLQLEQAFKRVRRGERLAVLYLDVDHLKRINDTLGHSAGDKLLKGVADRLRDCIRGIDVVARLSGDEFAIIQSSLNQNADAAVLATRVREAIHEPFDLDDNQVVVDISIGISIAPDDASEFCELLKTADIALYEAKNLGRGTYCFYEAEMNARVQVRAELERDIQGALTDGEFELFYQPIASLDGNKIASFEALLRWHHPQRGLVSPAEFIPIAEETGLIIPLGEWVVRTACAEAANWPDDVRVAVNVSSVQLTSRNLVNVVVGAIASAGIEPNRLELEITESVLMQNTFANLATLKRLHELGVHFAMDDFGTGYSSLGYLLSFPFHRIKIDRSFILGLADKGEARAIVRATVDLARSLGMRVTAEGVETAQQLQQVRILGCTEIQGYLLHAPRPAAEILQLLASPPGRAACSVIPGPSAIRKSERMCHVRPDLRCNRRLTGRECDVLKGIMAGESTEESARQLNRKPQLVEHYRERIKQKIGASNLNEVIQIMMTKGCSAVERKRAMG